MSIFTLESFAAGPKWTTSYKTALSLAERNDKPIMAFFTGSDWCGWCVKLEEEVFSKSSFISWSKGEVVPLLLDFPRGKSQSSTLKRQNAELAQKFQVSGYPSVIFIDPNTEGSIGKTGYLKGGPDSWIANAKKILSNRPAPPSIPSISNLSEAKGDKEILVLVSRATDKTTEKLDKLLSDKDAVKSLESRVVAMTVLQSEGLDDKLKEALGEKTISSFKFGGYALLDGEMNLLASGRMPSSGRYMASTIQRALPKLTYKGGWIEDAALATQFAKELKRPIMMNFTGSDWCGYCIKLEKEVFSKSEFEEYAKENLVLLKVDFPRKTKQSPSQAKANQALSSKYGIRGFPTLILINSKGSKIGQMGYMKGGPKPFLEALKKQI